MSFDAPWENAPVDPAYAPPPAVAAGGGSYDAPPLTICGASAGSAAPLPNAQPSPVQGTRPAPADARPWESAPIDPDVHGNQGGDASAAIGYGLINGVPIVGPALTGGLDRVAAGIRSLQNGTSYDDELRNVQQFDQDMTAQHPVATTAGQLGGAVLSTIPLAAAAPVAFGAEGHRRSVGLASAP